MTELDVQQIRVNSIMEVPVTFQETTGKNYPEKMPLVLICATMLIILYATFNPYISNIHDVVRDIIYVQSSRSRINMQSQYCQMVCKNGNKCCNLSKATHEGKNVCLLHHRVLKLSEDSCSICMETMSHRSSMKIASCGHFFHKDCLTKWAEQNKDTCPLCRKPMDAHTLVAVNRGMLDYIGMMMFTLPQEQRQMVLHHVVNVIDGAFAMHQVQQQVQPIVRQPSTGNVLHTVDTPMGEFAVVEDRTPNSHDVSNIPIYESIDLPHDILAQPVPLVPRDPRIPAS